ncbi:MAG: transporter substrate-binding domain-containing protein [Mobiluncus porci]|nr:MULTISPECIES: transporter substrate-binding domain-containing protein [Mobiluncus]MCI6584860.1 transporter substrate-binding domain-containing protein [Mobiluncus sp.]MDD7541675.1 transporter substrate-binding domain-containing protein [Mobiluncus porci]MDY5749246.1 transporter substrate-binding domain-containing protein [Mobiluncus porci]
MKKLFGTLALLAGAISLAACGSGSVDSLKTGEASPSGETSSAAKAGGSGVEDGVFTVAMEAAYAPYNWAQPDDANGAVKIKGAELYANGYDVMTAKEIADANGWKLEIVQLEWDSLIPAVQAGTVDATIAGQSMTKEREKTVDFAGPYLYANIVALTKADSKFAGAKGLADLAGGKATSQSGTVWYDTLIPQIKDVDKQPPAASAPAMLMALETGQVDYVVTDMPTAQGALIAYPDMKILDFSSGDDNFKASDEDVNIGIAIRKGNTELKDGINAVLKDKTAEDFNKLMEQAAKIQPLQK